MKNTSLILALSISVLAGCASSSAQTPTALELLSQKVAAKTKGLTAEQSKQFTPKPAPYPVAEPSAVYSSATKQDLDAVHPIFKVDRLPLGVLKWTKAQDRDGDPVIGYEIQRDSSWPMNTTFRVPAEETTFPFNAGGDAGMINPVAGEYWRVRAVFKSGARSSWVPSQTFPEHFSTSY